LRHGPNTTVLPKDVIENILNTVIPGDVEAAESPERCRF
jgi:hypothetical protein